MHSRAPGFLLGTLTLNPSRDAVGIFGSEQPTKLAFNGGTGSRIPAAAVAGTACGTITGRRSGTFFIKLAIGDCVAAARVDATDGCITFGFASEGVDSVITDSSTEKGVAGDRETIEEGSNDGRADNVGTDDSSGTS